MDFERGLEYCEKLKALFGDQQPTEAEYSRFCYCRDNCSLVLSGRRGLCSIATRFENVVEYMKGEGYIYNPGKSSTGRHRVKYRVVFEDKDGNRINYLTIGHAISSIEYDMAKHK